jgi:tetratricopeptide (TPR) repeat protein
LEKAAECASEDGIIKEHLGDAYLKSNLNDKALDMYEKALKLEPEKVELKKKIEDLRDSEGK